MEVKRREKTKEAVEREKLKAEQEMADQAIVEAERVKIYGLEQRTGKYLPVKFTVPMAKFGLDLCAVVPERQRWPG